MAVALAALSLAAPALGQDGLSPEAQRRRAEFERRGQAAISRGDFEAAEDVFREQIEAEPGNFVPIYHLACAMARGGKINAAATQLVRAVSKGFVDVHGLKRDGDLREVRETDAIKELIARWPAVLDEHANANLALAREFFPDTPKETYQQQRDDALRVIYHVAADPTSFEQAQEDIARLSRWGIASVFPELATDAELDPWVVVILPKERHFLKWAIAQYGQDVASGSTGIGGAYAHDQKRLVAMDLGPTLRHEFFHVLHWRSTTRRGQDHPVWIQEGLCSLVEEYRIDPAIDASLPRPDHAIEPLPSWRTNMAKRMLSAGKLVPLGELAKMPRDRFTGERPLAHYAHARAVFLYLYQMTQLRAWYANYQEHYAEDPSGVKALERTFGKPIADIDRDFRAWLRKLPEVAEQTKPGRASLGVEVEPGTGDGPVIAAITARSRARAAGLMVGDVITAIDGQPCRDLNELVRLLGDQEPGEMVRVSIRRKNQHLERDVPLINR